MKLKLKSAARKVKDQIEAWMRVVESYPFRRTVFNHQRSHRHPAMMSAARRRKLRRS